MGSSQRAGLHTGTVDAATQNGFCSYKLSFHKKTNVMQIMTKNITIYIF
jgi:hypothetical protein